VLSPFLRDSQSLLGISGQIVGVVPFDPSPRSRASFFGEEHHVVAHCMAAPCVFPDRYKMGMARRLSPVTVLV
jgi:hypothetical protein